MTFDISFICIIFFNLILSSIFSYFLLVSMFGLVAIFSIMFNNISCNKIS
jgi:hypothetical protein